MFASPRGTPWVAEGRVGVVVPVAFVVGVVGVVGPWAAGWPRSTSACPGAPPAGVGSNWVHPSPASHTSGQACASRAFTENSLVPASYSPAVNPTATRAGSPIDRAIAAY